MSISLSINLILFKAICQYLSLLVLSYPSIKQSLSLSLYIYIYIYILQESSSISQVEGITYDTKVRNIFNISSKLINSSLFLFYILILIINKSE